MKLTDKKLILITAVTLITGIIIGWLIFKPSKNNENEAASAHTHEADNGEAALWTCAMHPQVKQNEPGFCPICGMELVPLKTKNKDADLNPKALKMSKVAMKLAQIQSTVVKKAPIRKTIRVNGKTVPDERLIKTQATHLKGRIESLYVNFTGEFVKKGQRLAVIYSPELLTAQQELLEALKIKENQPVYYESAVKKLKNWKITDAQIKTMTLLGEGNGLLEIVAEQSGFVTQKSVNEGDYVNSGQALYQITSLSRIWVEFDIYEKDLTWLKTNDTVTYRFKSHQGVDFSSKITYVEPYLTSSTRSVIVRTELENSDLTFKPGLYAEGLIRVDRKEESAIIIPVSAVLWSGKKSVVYIKMMSNSDVSFMMREVTLGALTDFGYIVDSGLAVGEEIAVNGTFSIDAAAQLAGKPSMMNPEGGSVSMAMPGMDMGMGMNMDSDKDMDVNMNMNMNSSSAMNEEVTVSNSNEYKEMEILESEKQELSGLFVAYFKLKDYLVDNDLKSAETAGRELFEAVNIIDMKLENQAVIEFWQSTKSQLSKRLEHLNHLESLEKVRNEFLEISKITIDLAKRVHPLREVAYVQYCPMADNENGGLWLSRKDDIKNPYFGDAMLTCGEVLEEIRAINN